MKSILNSIVQLQNRDKSWKYWQRLVIVFSLLLSILALIGIAQPLSSWLPIAGQLYAWLERQHPGIVLPIMIIVAFASAYTMYVFVVALVEREVFTLLRGDSGLALRLLWRHTLMTFSRVSPNKIVQQPVVGDQFWKITLFEVPPTCWDQFELKLDKIVSDREAHWFQVLGEHDYAIVESISEYPDEAVQSYLELRSLITDVQEVICFTWSSQHSKLLDLLRKYDSLGIVFLKINSKIISKLGTKIENLAAHHLANIKQIDSVTVHVLGNIGWHELIALVFSNNLQRIMDTVLEFRKSKLKHVRRPLGTVELSRLDDDLSLFSLSHTLPAISGGEFNVEGKIRPAIFVYCAAYGEDYISKNLLKESGFVVRTVLGQRDLLIEPSSETVSPEELGNVLKRLAAEKGGRILAARTYLTFPFKREESEIYKEQIASYGEETETQELVRELSRFADQIENRLGNDLFRQTHNIGQIILAYSNAWANPILRELTSDMKGFMTETRLLLQDIYQKANNFPTVNSEIRRLYEQLDDVTDLFEYGFSQRMGGIQIRTPIHENPTLTLHRAGIQRIITAANAIPRDLLEQVGSSMQKGNLRWHGFTIFGYQPLTCRLPNGVMNLPFPLLLDPSKWWQLGHETGHEHSRLIRLHKRSSIRNLVKSYSQEYFSDKEFTATSTEREIATHDLIQEIFANVFEFEFVFLRNWGLYEDTVWPFLNKFLEGEDDQKLISRYLLRELFVFVYHIENNLDLESHVRLEQLALDRKEQQLLELDANLMETIRRRVLNESGSKDQSDGEKRPRIVEGIVETFLEHTVRARAPMIEILDEDKMIQELSHQFVLLEQLRIDLRFLLQESLSRADNLFNQPRLISIAGRLEYGEIITDQEVTPSDILLALRELSRRRQSLTLRTRVSAILSLWHWQITYAMK